jgi:hypothetical protein
MHDKGRIQNEELTEERFFEQFAALEDGLTLLQLQMRRMSENARLFGGLVTRMRQSACPVTDGAQKTFIHPDSEYPLTSAEMIRSKVRDRQSSTIAKPT